jgi:hypothetical protein
MFNPRKPHGEVGGTGVAGARYYQDHQYYDVDHRYLFSDPGHDAPPGETRMSMEQAEAKMQERIKARERGELVDETPRKTVATPQRPIPPIPPQAPQTGEPELTPEQQLMQLNVPRLQELQLETLKAMNAEQPEDQRKSEKDLRAQVIKGAGAKEKLVKWLAENTDAK